MKGILQLKNDIIVSANSLACTKLKVDLETLLGTSIHDRLSDVESLLFNNITNRFRQNAMSEYLGDFQIKNGEDEFKYYSLKFHFIGLFEGATNIICYFKKNLQDREEIERQIRINRLYDALRNNSLDGIYTYDYFNERITDTNNQAVKILKYDNSEELIGLSKFELLPKYSPFYPQIKNLHDYVDGDFERIKRGESFLSKAVFLAKDGSQVLIKARLVPTFHRFGQSLVIFHDVTKEISTKISLRESENRYRYIFDNADEGIVYFDLTSTSVSMCNQNVFDLLGVNSIEALNELKLTDIIETNTSDEAVNLNQSFAQLIQDCIAGQTPTESFWICSKNGERRRVDTIFVSDTSEPQSPKVIIFLRDVTDLYETEIALTNKNKELNKYITSNLELENFAYFASHDLQTPLRSIISFTQLLRRSFKGQLTKDQQDYMNFVIQSSKEMKALVDDLLAYSRVNTSENEKQWFDVNELLMRIKNDLYSSIREKQATIHIETVPEKIWADGIKIKQIFQNLLTNAIKFSKENEPPAVRVSFQSLKDEWLFKVTDNGIGIEKEYLEKIFEMFERLHTSDVYEGTGIGLAIVKKIVEQHKGEIGVESEYHKGTTFWFTIAKPK